MPMRLQPWQPAATTTGRDTTLSNRALADPIAADRKTGDVSNIP
jgi:hypothetical protein